MDSREISYHLTTLISGQMVSAGIFASYNFEPDFFELDVIPLLLKPGIPLSSDDRVKTFQVREALRESGLELEVFYDLPVFRQSAERSPQMEYLCHGVNQGNNAFHAKSIYLLLAESATKPQRLLVAAGSNNLTRAGWWENIEVQHWEKVISGETQRAFLNRLREDINWLIEKRGLEADSALERTRDFLASCRSANDANSVYYYGPGNQRDVFSFLRNVRGESLDNYQNWSLEIISPFFADDPKNELHLKFLDKFGVKKILMLLPQDQEGVALCKEEYFDHIDSSDDIAWARWNTKVGKTLGSTEELFRRVHAKIYHFYNGKQAWALVGSINFSHKAFHDNVEAGFLVKLDNIEPLLEMLPRNVEIPRFEPPTDNTAAGELDLDLTTLPELHLSYDWLTQELKGRTSKGMQYEIEIKNAEGHSVIGFWLLKDQEEVCTQPVILLEELLRQGSLVTVSGKNVTTSEAFVEHKILLQQTSWTHKPIDLPSLTPEQILEIYAGMSEERRQLMLMNAQTKQLVLRNMGGEITFDADDTLHDQFFCEFAEVFHSFRMFKQRLLTSLEKKDNSQIDYYLTGTGMDSLPSLLERVSAQKADDFSAVTAYLLMLAVRELYRYHSFVHRPNVTEMLNALETKIATIKCGDTIRLEGNSPEKRNRFFAWYEDQFSKEYVTGNTEREIVDEAS